MSHIITRDQTQHASLFKQAGSFGIPPTRQAPLRVSPGTDGLTGWKRSQKASSRPGSHSASQGGPARPLCGSSL